MDKQEQAQPQSPQPPAHAKLLSISGKLRRQIDEVEKTVAQSLGYYCAGMAPDMSRQLSRVLEKVKGLYVTTHELDAVKHEVSDMLSQLKRYKRENDDLQKEREGLINQLAALTEGLVGDMGTPEREGPGQEASKKLDGQNVTEGAQAKVTPENEGRGSGKSDMQITEEEGIMELEEN